MSRWIAVLCFLSSVLLNSCTQDREDFEDLVAWMTGSFSSEQQAAADSAYFDIRLEMVRIWEERADGAWLYVEQAAAWSLQKPYRQRVYHVRALEDGAFTSEVYSLPDPLRFTGHWRENAPLSSLSPDSLLLREGCAVLLMRDADGSFTGGTEGRNCGSGLRGAAYATSEVVVRWDRIESWDRGFDDSGSQVWGAEQGPYIFLRRDDTGLSEG